jgi:hypothetical protein
MTDRHNVTMTWPRAPLGPPEIAGTDATARAQIASKRYCLVNRSRLLVHMSFLALYQPTVGGALQATILRKPTRASAVHAGFSSSDGNQLMGRASSCAPTAITQPRLLSDLIDMSRLLVVLA